MARKSVVIYVVDLDGNEDTIYSYTFVLRRTYQCSEGDYPFDEETVFLHRDKKDNKFRFRVFEGPCKAFGDLDESCIVPGIIDDKYFISDSKELADIIFKLAKENALLREKVEQNDKTINKLAKHIVASIYKNF